MKCIIWPFGCVRHKRIGSKFHSWPIILRPDGHYFIAAQNSLVLPRLLQILLAQLPNLARIRNASGNRRTDDFLGIS
jgi:hypothetical protein